MGTEDVTEICIHIYVYVCNKNIELQIYKFNQESMTATKAKKETRQEITCQYWLM